MEKITTVGIDLAKIVFSLHGVDTAGMSSQLTRPSSRRGTGSRRRQRLSVSAPTSCSCAAPTRAGPSVDVHHDVAARPASPDGSPLTPRFRGQDGSVLVLVLERELQLGPEGDSSAFVQVDVLLDDLSHPQVVEGQAASIDGRRDIPGSRV